MFYSNAKWETDAEYQNRESVCLCTWGWESSALVARMQKSPQVVTDIRLFTYFTNFSLFFVSQNTTLYSILSGRVYAYTTVFKQ